MPVVGIVGTRELHVVPGETVVYQLRVRNDNQVVDELTMSVLGAASGWTEILPPVVRLFPAAEAEVTVRFRPPRIPSTPAEPIPFGVKVSSSEHPDGTVVEEGVLIVEPFEQLAAELAPRTSRGRRAGRHRLAVDNQGNVPLEVSFGGSNAEDALTIRFLPATTKTEPGTATMAKLKVRPEKLFLTGPPRPHAFEVVVQPNDGPTETLDGMFIQQPLLPKWILRTAAIGAALVVGAVVLWLTVGRAAVRSTAKGAARHEASSSRPLSSPLVYPAKPGPQGPNGAVGATGPIGSKGPAGTSGPAGHSGATGPQGAAGLKGDAGPSGATGPHGAAGLKGDTGPIGAAGSQGATGPAGPRGAAGSSGPAGPSGPPGISTVYQTKTINAMYPLNANDASIAQTPALPSGNYLVMATVVIHIAPGDTVTCFTTPASSATTHTIGDSSTTSNPSSRFSYNTVEITDTWKTTANNDKIDLVCHSELSSSAQGTAAILFSITAVPADNLNVIFSDAEPQ